MINCCKRLILCNKESSIYKKRLSISCNCIINCCKRLILCNNLSDIYNKHLNQFAIRNSQFAITFCDGDFTPTQNVLPVEAGELNPKTLLNHCSICCNELMNLFATANMKMFCVKLTKLWRNAMSTTGYAYALLCDIFP